MSITFDMKRSRAYRDLVTLESICAKSAKCSSNGIWVQEGMKRSKVCLEANEFMHRIFSSEVSLEWARSNSDSKLSRHAISTEKNSRSSFEGDTCSHHCWKLGGITKSQQQGLDDKYVWQYDITLDLSLSMYLDLDLKQ